MRAVLEVSLPFWLEGSGFQAAVSTWVTRIKGTDGGSLQSTLVVIGWVAQPKETTLLGPSSHEIKDWVTCDEVSLPGYQKPVSLLAKPSRDLFPYAHWVRKSKTGAHVWCLCLFPHTLQSFSFSFLLLQKDRIFTPGLKRAAAGHSGYCRLNSFLYAWDPQVPISRHWEAADLAPP